MFPVAVWIEEVPYGYVVWERFMGFFLRFLLTFFLCLALIYVVQHSEFRLDIDMPNNQPAVTASPGFISLSHEVLDNSNTVQVVSHSLVSVDAVVKAKDGRDLLTYFGLMPSESFYFEYDEPCTITAIAC